MLKWFEVGMFELCNIGICFSEKHYKKYIKSIGLADSHEFLPDGSDACMHTIPKGHNGKRTFLITTNPKPDVPRNTSETHSLLVHECVHVWQEVKRTLREDNPGDEIEAYFIHWLSLQCFAAFSKEREQ